MGLCSQEINYILHFLVIKMKSETLDKLHKKSIWNKNKKQKENIIKIMKFNWNLILEQNFVYLILFIFFGVGSGILIVIWYLLEWILCHYSHHIFNCFISACWTSVSGSTGDDMMVWWGGNRKENSFQITEQKNLIMNNSPLLSTGSGKTTL